MIACRPGTIVLVRFPFTDLSQTKKRPALIISPEAYSERYGDMIVLAMTSRPQAGDASPVRYWQEAGLPKPTWIKPLIATLATASIVKPLGSLQQDEWPGVQSTLHAIIAPPFPGILYRQQ